MSGSPVACPVCGFDLWTVLSVSQKTAVGLYDDWRFPGRLIVSMLDHHDDFSDLPSETAHGFMEEVAHAAATLRTAMNADRVNIAILGNSESHVHAHLVPRWADRDPNPTKSPWDDPRPRRGMEDQQKVEVIGLLRAALGDVSVRSSAGPTNSGPSGSWSPWKTRTTGRLLSSLLGLRSGRR